ncbi:helicase-associated domain-containing protein [Paenibacillus sediminis]|uniref:Helicase XPB/Ssl2 N-terminal domain-containing protein n=1 Tax=Paenibacillus sediminis TaxID=664909 RepID=A0ABS4GZ57_9BACL|nr:helicase-associated domain-containing protein [Paenibacillus sediminis]MBP1935555.1 hypothetical protein [Paenibacillus sediminis]
MNAVTNTKQIQPKEQVAVLSLAGRKVLKNLLQRYAGQPFLQEQLVQLPISDLSGAEVIVEFIQLRRLGLIRAVKKAWGERLYYIPEDFLSELQQSMFNIHVSQAEPSEITLTKEAKSGIANDLFRALVWAGKNGLPITAKGTLHKKTMNKLSEQIEVSCEDFNLLELKYVHQDIYPVHLAVVLDLLLYTGLVRKGSDAFLLETTAIEGWLNKSFQEMQHILFWAAMERYTIPNPSLQHYRYSILSPSLMTTGWYRVRDVLQSLEQEGLMDSPEIAEINAQAIGFLHMMNAFGFADVGEDSSGNVCFRLISSFHETISLTDIHKSEEIKPTGRFYVEPDFEIVVPPDVPYSVRWELEICAEFVKMDLMSIYKLSKNSLAEATEHERSIQDITSFLEGNSLTGLPDNIKVTIAQWGKEIGRTHFAAVTLLRCTDEEAADEIASHPRLNEVVKRIGPRDFIVESDQIAGIRPVLEKMGLSPRKQVHGLGDEYTIFPRIPFHTADNDSSLGDTQYIDTDGSKGIVYSGRTLHFYEEDHDIPDADVFFPTIDSVPAMWSKEMRTYHPSTAQKIMEQALDWKTSVLLSIEGTTVEFIPHQIQSRDRWKARGYIRSEADPAVWTELEAGDWEEMKLVLPSK